VPDTPGAERTRQRLVIPETTVNRHVALQAGRQPQETALLYYGGRVSYGRLHDEVERLAGCLQRRLGVGRGDRVLLVMQNSPQYIVAYYAILRADAVVVPGNPMNRTAELRHFVEDSGACVAIVGNDVLAAALPLLREGLLEHTVLAHYADYVDPAFEVPLPEALAARPAAGSDFPLVVDWQEALADGTAPRPQQAGPEDLAVIPYSSGTTGQPKGCMHTHRTVMATLVGGIQWNPGSGERAVHLVSLPLFHVTGMQNGMNAPLYLGDTLVLMSRWDRRTAARLIERYRVQRWRSISTMAVDLLADPDLDSYDLSSLQGIGGGGAAMPAAVYDGLKARTGLDYIEGYGLTETMAATHINPVERPRRGCLGVPVFEVDARIRDPDSGAILGPGEPGEIVINAPQVVKGYWNNPEATAAAFVEIDGKRFFRTGDIATVDAEGYFYMVDRVKRMINLAGFKVWPAEIEISLHHHPGIAEACVVAAGDPRRGEVVKALVVPSRHAGPITAEAIVAWCRERMSAYKVPRIVEIVDSLPRSATGKIDWRGLQEKERNSAA